MDGGIYTREKCYKCMKILTHNAGRKGCFCPDHPDVRAHSFIVKFPGGIYQRHQNYEAACQSLNYLRHEKGVRKNLFDPDDYRSSRPNSIAGLKDKYLARKKNLASYGKVEHALNMADEHFGPMNVREITGAELEDYLYDIQHISEKTRKNHRDYLMNFWKWCLNRGVITLAEMPAFPEILYELGYRKITDWNTQRCVIETVKSICPNPKIYLAIDMLATYTAIRPEDIRRLNEDSLDNNGWLTITDPTKFKNNFKRIHLHPDHLIAWKTLNKKFPALPGAPFFRNIETGEVIGKNKLSRWWNKACALVGLEGVSLYAGTKHTTATETAKNFGKEKARSASGLTNKAFDRYCQAEGDENYEVVTAIRKKQMGTVIPLRKRKAE